MDPEHYNCRYFVSYNGVKLPLNLVNELHDCDQENRTNFFRGFYDAAKRLIRCEKLVYEEIDLLHRYEYHDNNASRRAEITDADGGLTVLHFETHGKPSTGADCNGLSRCSPLSTSL